MASGSPAQAQIQTLPNKRKRKVSSSSAAEEEEEEETETEELEREVADLGRRILEHRRGASGRLLDAAAARLATLRLPTRVEVQTNSEPVDERSLAEADQQKLEKLQLFKSKIEVNIAALPNLLKRMKDSVERIEKLDQCKVNIHPVFQRKR